ncbi:MAG: DUF885 domain-containing protein [Chloroflexi bacterium]|nr:DUF885 domain-containing protein [Chloroflexota bacterium]
MTRVYDIASDYVERYAALDPLGATSMGVPGHEDRMTDFSPEGAAARASLDRDTLASLEAAPVESERDRIARDAMMDALRTSLDVFEAGEYLRRLNILGSPHQRIRQVFDLMPRQTDEHWRNIAARLRLVPQALASYRQTLLEGARQRKASTKRQTAECAKQAEVWSGQRDGQPSFFQGLLDAYDKSGVSSAALRREVEAGVETANRAYAETGRFLLDDYLARASDKDAVGGERYALSSRSYNGTALDLEETYQWGWEQLHWVESEMAKTAERIAPGQGVEAAKQLLESDPSRSIEGVEAFRQWMQDLQNRTISELNGTHFDIPEPIKKIEAMIAPPGGALAMYYTPPSEDFSRPGRTWYPTGGKTRFPLWGEVSIAYHEGVPGHHFERATAKHLADRLSRFQRLMGGTSGYVEGWALYAERLMGELGYLENPDYYLGMLRAQALRSVRVIIDIGMHLELRIPRGEDFHPGEVWTPQLGLEFIRQRSHFPPDFVASEVDRYLGMPGQAISYKVGEREWLAARDDASRRRGASFNLKDFHTRALNIGPMGLAQMRRELAGV